MARYVRFYENLVECKSLEISVLVKIASSDVRSTTARNLATIIQETGVELLFLSATKVRNLVLIQPVPVYHE